MQKRPFLLSFHRTYQRGLQQPGMPRACWLQRHHERHRGGHHLPVRSHLLLHKQMQPCQRRPVHQDDLHRRHRCRRHGRHVGERDVTCLMLTAPDSCFWVNWYHLKVSRWGPKDQKHRNKLSERHKFTSDYLFGLMLRHSSFIIFMPRASF